MQVRNSLNDSSSHLGYEVNLNIFILPLSLWFTASFAPSLQTLIAECSELSILPGRIYPQNESFAFSSYAPFVGMAGDTEVDDVLLH